MTRSHIFLVPFAEAGHAINMLNVGCLLGTSDLQVHVLVLSRKNTEQWLKATGQPPNPNVTIEVIGDGKWEDWQYAQAADLVTMLFTPEFNDAVDRTIGEIRQQYPGDQHTAIMINPLMSPLVQVAGKHGLKLFLLNPTAFYMGRLSGARNPDGSSKPTDPVVYKGIGGSAEDMPAILGDAIDMIGPMAEMSKPCMDAADGVVYSNTNLGLEGDQYLQSHMPNCDKVQNDYMIGPILPSSYERALSDPEAMDAQLAAANQIDPCIQFLNKHPTKSVVYITTGSVAQLSNAQAQLIIKTLRQHNQHWILLYRNGKEQLEAELGDHSDGVITTWAPQLDVLIHPATKCVVGHGGFGTMIEGVFAGQPFICSPVFSDQFLDTKVMQLLGICVGNLAINNFESIMSMTELSPRWPDDNGKTVETVFEHAFGAEGNAVLDKARVASLALRERMVQSKATKGVEALRMLREEMEHPRSQIDETK